MCVFGCDSALSPNEQYRKAPWERQANNPMIDTSSYNQWLMDAARDTKPRKKEHPKHWLSQEMIDSIVPREKPGIYESWWDATAGLGGTILVIVCAGAGLWALWKIFSMGEVVINAAVRG